MKGLKQWTLGLFAVLISNAAFSQSEITDQDLYRYALMQEVVTLMKKDVSTEVNKMIKNQEGMTGQRYKELAATKGDADKLAAAEAQDWEIQFLGLVDKLKADRSEAIKTVNTALATKMVGDKGKVYKAIKEQISADEALASRYNTIKESLAKTDD